MSTRARLFLAAGALVVAIVLVTGATGGPEPALEPALTTVPAVSNEDVWIDDASAICADHAAVIKRLEPSSASRAVVLAGEFRRLARRLGALPLDNRARATFLRPLQDVTRDFELIAFSGTRADHVVKDLRFDASRALAGAQSYSIRGCRTLLRPFS